jgi:hypothetical protein
MKTKVFKMYNDPGHGWLAVKVIDLHDAGLIHLISRYSYIRGNTVYLEEDCDAPKFIENWKMKHGDFHYEFKHTDKHSPIRSYESFTAFAAEQVYKKLKGWA